MMMMTVEPAEVTVEISRSDDQPLLASLDPNSTQAAVTSEGSEGSQLGESSARAASCRYVLIGALLYISFAMFY
tara:strand:- start:402 stop:623 length:222 start_codon:yes stop_codon:yes gene_type:complete